MDEGMRVVDADALARINQIIAEHAADLEMAQVAPGILIYLLILIKNDRISIINVYCIINRRTSNQNGRQVFKFG